MFLSPKTPSEISNSPTCDLRYLYDNTVNYLEFSFVNFHPLLFWKLVICPWLRGKTKTMSKVSHSWMESPQTVETWSSAGQSHSFGIFFRNTATVHPANPNCHTTLPLHSGMFFSCRHLVTAPALLWEQASFWKETADRWSRCKI